LFTEKSSTAMPVRRARRAASARVMGMVVSRQHAEQPIGTQGRDRPMNRPKRPAFFKKGGRLGDFTGD
jgi:hypothetical protein